MIPLVLVERKIEQGVWVDTQHGWRQVVNLYVDTALDSRLRYTAVEVDSDIPPCYINVDYVVGVESEDPYRRVSMAPRLMV